MHTTQWQVGATFVTIHTNFLFVCSEEVSKICCKRHWFNSHVTFLQVQIAVRPRILATNMCVAEHVYFYLLWINGWTLPCWKQSYNCILCFYIESYMGQLAPCLIPGGGIRHVAWQAGECVTLNRSKNTVSLWWPYSCSNSAHFIIIVVIIMWTSEKPSQ